MKVQNIQNQNTNFNGLLNNKVALAGLEKISEHGASFAAGVSLAGALLLRPFAIHCTPDTKKENKQMAGANSISSGIAKFLTAQAITIPIENAIKKIDSNPEKYLSSKTITNLKTQGKNLVQSRNYKFATQLVKLAGGLISALPKSVVTVALIPVLADNFFNKKNKQNNNINLQKYAIQNSAFKKFLPDDNPAFKGGGLANKIGKILNSDSLQDFTQKHVKNDSNIARNFSNATDALLTGVSVFQIKKSDKIEQKTKNPLIYNNILSTAMCIIFGDFLDFAVKKKSQKYMDKFIKQNKDNPKLLKYLEGINILRPTLIFAGVYYAILPVITTFLADKIDDAIPEFEKS